MRTAADYDRYLAAFNARDYAAVLRFFTPDVILHTEGYAIRGHAGIKRFYDFLHAYVREEIEARRTGAGPGVFFADVVMRLTGVRALSQDVLDAHGFSRFTPAPQGASVEVPLLIVYELDGELVREIRCAVPRVSVG
jgi:hypothetical protein